VVDRVYLDWNASAPLRQEARAAMIAALDVMGNPSSIHRDGRLARHLIDDAREKVAALVGAEPRDVVFTSGGTEANTLALGPSAENARLLVSSIEHPSVRSGGRFSPPCVEDIPVTANGIVDLAALRGLLEAPRTGPVQVSIMLANNESGVVQPIAAAAKIVHAAGGALHVDAVQAVGRMPVDMATLGADLLTLSAHKIGGPKGVGALVRRGDASLVPAIKGGGQERGRRAGTENLAGIVGFGAAAAAVHRAGKTEIVHIRALRDRLEAGLRDRSPHVTIFAADCERLANTTLFAVPGVKAETAVISLDLDGASVSSGAACSSGKVQPSHVLAAMGVAPELARGAIRVSLGHDTAESDINRFLAAWLKFCGALHNAGDGIAA
jgi:cysteine desulfurase